MNEQMQQSSPGSNQGAPGTPPVTLEDLEARFGTTDTEKISDIDAFYEQSVPLQIDIADRSYEGLQQQISAFKITSDGTGEVEGGFSNGAQAAAFAFVTESSEDLSDQQKYTLLQMIHDNLVKESGHIATDIIKEALEHFKARAEASI